MNLRKLLSAILAVSLVFGLVSSAMASTYSPGTAFSAAEKMAKLGLVKGRAPGDYALNETITRAELVTVLVRALGREDDAKILAGAPSFKDIAPTEWYAPYVALAKNLGITSGYPDGTFQPNAPVTAAESIAFLVKFLGLPVNDSLGWPNSFLASALDAGIITTDDNVAAFANTAAPRGMVFFFGDKAFSSVKLETSGKTVYQTYVDNEPPSVTVDDVASVTTATSVTVTGKVSGHTVLHVGLSSADWQTVTASADGSFSASVDLKVGENDILVHAVDLAGNQTLKTVRVTREYAAIAAVDVASSLAAQAGETADLAITVKDANGATIDGAEVEVTASPEDLGSYADGVFTAGTKAQSGTLTVKAGDVVAEVAVTVNPGDLAAIKVDPATASIGVGGNQAFTVKGEDAYGNEVELDAKGVTWTASKGVISPTGVFGATNDAAGDITITATVGDLSGTASVSVFGAAVKVDITAPEQIVANDKSETTLTATVKDANGNVAKDYNGTVTFTSSNTSAVSVKTASVQAVNGVATTTIKAGTTRAATVLMATASGLTGSTVTYTPDAQVVTSVAVSGPSSMAASTGSEGTITLKLKDQTGNDILAGNVPTGSNQIKVKLTSSDKTVAFFNTDSDNTEVTMDAASKPATIKATSKVGAVTVSAAITAPSGSTVSTNSISLSTLVVGAAYQITVDEIASKKVNETFTVVFRVKDFNGNTLTWLSESDLYTLEVYSGNTLVYTLGSLDLVLGVGKNVTSAITIDPANFGNVGGTNYARKAGDYTVKVKKSGLTTGEGTVTLAPAAAAVLSLSASPSTLAANGSSQSTLKVTISDGYGNKVTDGSYSVTIKKTSSDGATASFADTTVTTVNGEATVVVTSTTKQSATGDTYTASATGLSSGSTVVRTAIMGAPYQLTLASMTPSGAAGSDIAVNVEVRDAAGTLLTTDNGRLVTVTVKDGSTTMGTFSGTTTNGVAKVNVNLTKAKAFSFSAASEGLVSVTGTSLTVTPASAASVKVVADRSTLAANTASKAMLTFSLLDEYGNTVTAGANTQICYAVTSGTVAGIESGAAACTLPGYTSYKAVTLASGQSSVSTSDGTNSLVVTAAAEGSVVIEARSGSLTAATTTVSTKVTGTAAGLNVDTISDTSASASGSPVRQEVVVRIVDGNGNQLTHDSLSTVSLSVYAGATGTVVGYYHDGTNWQAYTFGNAVTATKGQVKFGVIDTKADTLTYRVSTNAVASYNKDVTGKFVPGTAVALAVDTSTPGIVAGNGSSLTTVTARVVDGFGNTVTSATGTMSFSIHTGNDHAMLLNSSAPVVNGTASVAAQSKVTTNDNTIGIRVKYDLNGDGDTEDSGESFDSAANIFTVDATKPTVSTVVYGNGGVASSFDSGDTITINFSEAMDSSSVAASGTFSDGNILGIGSFATGGTNSGTWTATWSSSTQLVVTLTVNTGTAAPSGNFTVSSALKDVAGNSYSPAAVTPTGSW